MSIKGGIATNKQINKQVYPLPWCLHLVYMNRHDFKRHQKSGAIFSTWQNYCSAGKIVVMPKCKYLLSTVPQGTLLYLC